VCKGAAVLRPARSIVVLGALTLVVSACSGGSGSAGGKKPTSQASLTPPASSAPATSGSAGALRITLAPWKLPSPSSREVLLTDGRQLFVAGGLDAAKQTTGSVVRVDPSTGSSQPAGSLAQPVHDAAGAVVKGMYLVVGGGTGEEGSAAVQSFGAGAAGKVVGTLPAPRSDHVAVELDGKVYVVGGFDGHQIIRDVLVSDDGASYRTLGALAEPVRYPAVAAAGGAIYVFGGVVSASGADTRAIQKIDPANGQVTVVGQLPASLSHANAVVLGDQVLVLGGFVNNQVSAQVLRFDPRTSTVTDAGSLPAPVSDGAAATVGDTAYLVGGQGTDRAPVAAVVTLKLG
jgi:N-acetylneuraminic acid mutarotase